MHAETTLQIVAVDPCNDPLWQQLVNCRDSDVFHSPRWLRVLADTYDLNLRAYIALDADGSPYAGMPFCFIDDMFGPRIVSMPFSDYCDPLVDDHESWKQLVDLLLDVNHPVTLRCLHNQIPLDDNRLVIVKRARWHKIDLQRDLETIWNSLHESSRRAIRKARQTGVVVRVAETQEDLRAFFNMHMQTRKYKYRMVAQPFHFFEQIWRHFIEAGFGQILLATFQNQIISGTMYLEWQDKIYYKFNTSLMSSLAQRPNDLLVWEGITSAMSKQYRLLDFGLSDWDQEGLLRFKRKFATEEGTISFLRHTPMHASDDRERDLRALIGQLTGLLTDPTTSDMVTEQAGSLLYRYFV